MKKLVLLISIIAMLMVAVGCQSEATPQIVKETVVVVETVEVITTVEVVETVEVVVTQEVPVEVPAEAAPFSDVPFQEKWASSGHNDVEAEAFIHWNEDDPVEIPTRCAKCHSTPGFLDFLGADGTEMGVVDNAAPIGTTVQCVACHNDVTMELDSVTFPSGVTIEGLGREARCMQCHQGRSSTVTVDNAIEEAGLTEDVDTVSEDIGFSNIHYFAAAATQAGGTAMGGYQYADKVYDAKFAHVEEFNTCIGCHDPHTLELKVEDCQSCHEGVLGVEDLVNVRWAGSLVDYDGDGDMEEGIYYEIETLRDTLYGLMQSYATNVSGTDIVYESHNYPYFFIDSNGNGTAEEDEAAYANSYNAWTPRLAKAAYNYQTSLKDPGGFAHGGKYIIQLLYDSIDDLNMALGETFDMSTIRRIDHGHFAGSEEAFRHWDEDGGVSGRCSKCHSAQGLPLYLEQGVTIEQPVSNGLLCSTCHESVGKSESPRYEVEEVEFPSGLTVTVEDTDANTMLCINCHQGRQSSADVNNAIEGLDADTVAESLRFLNIHYYPAGVSLFGTLAQGAYQNPNNEYNGFTSHPDEMNGCADCHSAHALTVQVDECAECHESVSSMEDVYNIRGSSTEEGSGPEVDFDGDGDAEEGMSGEIKTMKDALYAAMQDYSVAVVGSGIVYESHSYPYFFTDTNGDGVANEDEAVRANAYSTWTPNLLQAAYNYQYVSKDPGAFAHNGEYVLQVLFDSLSAVGDTTGMTRPDVKAPAAATE